MQPLQLSVDRDELEAQGFSDFEIDEMNTILAPIVAADKCVGCGICTYRCHKKFVVQKGRLDESAITIDAQNEHRRLTFPLTAEELGPADT
jgi:ferredoxin